MCMRVIYILKNLNMIKLKLWKFKLNSEFTLILSILTLRNEPVARKKIERWKRAGTKVVLVFLMMSVTFTNSLVFICMRLRGTSPLFESSVACKVQRQHSPDLRPLRWNRQEFRRHLSFPDVVWPYGYWKLYRQTSNSRNTNNGAEADLVYVLMIYINNMTLDITFFHHFFANWAWNVCCISGTSYRLRVDAHQKYRKKAQWPTIWTFKNSRFCGQRCVKKS